MSALAGFIIPTPSKALSGCSNAPFTANSTMSARRIYTATLAEADFKYNHRSALGYDDTDRATALLRGTKGKRLLYRQPDQMPTS
jgi:hypothetical protein